ncbi:MAG: DinB family protein [Hydrogenophaga sp.]|uniref:DinB family protein n=1 Tax=Hydrogenophaga sp. TaxID=1904254 RepID=UPI001E0F2C89|nr:DinB family protein [Hydrogenophaga sp.]MBX3611216.1 DinB family protein [Hydrogenophaga sp.]
MDARSHFLTLAQYHLWATQRLLDATASLADEAYRRDVGLFFKSVHGTLNHLLVGESMLWQRRFALGESPQVALDAEVEADRLQLAQALIHGARVWSALISEWPIERFDGHLDYTTMRGNAVSLPFAPTLAHVFNHATHHRGQVSAALTALGQPAPVLDLVYFLQAQGG